MGRPRLALAIGLAALCLAGCGSGGSSTRSTQPSQAPAPPRGPQPPAHASALARGIYRSFPPPRADPEARGSAKAIKAGEAACEGKTPKEAKRRYYPVAIQKGALEAKSPQARMIAGLARYEKRPDSAYTAGQLAADAYQASLGGGVLARYGYEGCVYALARGLEGRLG